MKMTIYVVAVVVGIALIAWIGFSYTGSNKSSFVGPVSADEPLPEALIADLQNLSLDK